MGSTQKEIAKALGLSVTTVSRALKDHPDISEETKKRVREMAKLIGYEPNLLAVRLRTGKSMILGIMVPHISNLFYESFITAVEEEARKIGYGIMILQSAENTETELQNLEALKRHRVDGILIAPALETTDIIPFLEIQKAGTPIVFFDRVPTNDQIVKVFFDNEKIGELAARYCIEEGKKQVLGLFWGNDKVLMTQKRRQGFERAIEKASYAINLKPYYHTYIEDAKQLVLRLLNDNEIFDAIFCTGDGALIGTIQAIKEAKTMIPESLTIISVSNGFIPTLYDIDISIIETNGFRLGKAAFAKMSACWTGTLTSNETRIDVF